MAVEAKSHRILVGLVALLATGACASGRASPLLARPAPRAPVAAPTELTLLNDTIKDACYVYLAPFASGRRGPDRLEGREVIRPGEERGFLLPRDGIWNVRVQDCRHHTIAERTGLAVTSSIRLKLTRMAVPPSPARFAGSIPLRIYNDTPDTVASLLMSPTPESQWGTNWLGRNEMIPTGGERVFMVEPGEAWDIRVRDKGRARLAEGRGIPILGPTTVSISSLTQR